MPSYKNTSNSQDYEISPSAAGWICKQRAGSVKKPDTSLSYLARQHYEVRLIFKSLLPSVVDANNPDRWVFP
jgi:hypothetical protein